MSVKHGRSACTYRFLGGVEVAARLGHAFEGGASACALGLAPRNAVKVERRADERRLGRAKPRLKIDRVVLGRQVLPLPIQQRT